MKAETHDRYTFFFELVNQPQDLRYLRAKTSAVGTTPRVPVRFLVASTRRGLKGTLSRFRRRGKTKTLYPHVYPHDVNSLDSDDQILPTHGNFDHTGLLPFGTRILPDGRMRIPGIITSAFDSNILQ